MITAPLQLHSPSPGALIASSRATDANDPEVKQVFTSIIMPLIYELKDAAFATCQR
ncbi:uncharacterized protein RSE6_06477 [Rhynchosporium secalis]|uniref:Uncharacterized protein n=1 Tax=Rhynchosporium secalis TaxID=38038 RepID=A0A1E1MAJ8_RHYSE|nr:uncharacterized protein RSE6_06477 [Rhynchosporium secalis]